MMKYRDQVVHEHRTIEIKERRREVSKSRREGEEPKGWKKLEREKSRM